MLWFIVLLLHAVKCTSLSDQVMHGNDVGLFFLLELESSYNANAQIHD